MIMYAIRRGDKWLDKRYQWGSKEYRRLWKSQTGVVRAINEADRVGLEPAEVFDLMVKSGNTFVVAVEVTYTDHEEQPVTLGKVKPFKHRWDKTDNWWTKKKGVDADAKMASYSIEKMPGK